MKTIRINMTCNYNFVRAAKIEDYNDLYDLYEEGELSDFIYNAVDNGEDESGIMKEWEDEYYNAMSFEGRGMSIYSLEVEITDSEGKVLKSMDVDPMKMGIHTLYPEEPRFNKMLRNQDNEMQSFIGFYDEYHKEFISFEFNIKDNEEFSIKKLQWVESDEIDLDSIFDCGGSSISPFKIAYDGKIYECVECGDNTGSSGATTFVGYVEFEEADEEGEPSYMCFNIYDEDNFEDLFD